MNKKAISLGWILSVTLCGLVLAQDVGGAIRGRIRGDLYWGGGDEAARWAGNMRATGRYTMLVPRDVPLTAVSGQ